jgi:hypothetical protein
MGGGSKAKDSLKGGLGMGVVSDSVVMGCDVQLRMYVGMVVVHGAFGSKGLPGWRSWSGQVVHVDSACSTAVAVCGPWKMGKLAGFSLFRGGQATALCLRVRSWR